MDDTLQAAADRPLRPAEVVAEFIALSVVESSYTPGLTLSVEIDGCTATLTDNGRGMRLVPDDGDDVPHAQRPAGPPQRIGPTDAEGTIIRLTTAERIDQDDVRQLIALIRLEVDSGDIAIRTG